MSTVAVTAALATNGWAEVTVTEPDFFGDVRIAATHKQHGKYLAVIDRDGKLAGVYLHDKQGKHWHGTRVADATRWAGGAA